MAMHLPQRTLSGIPGSLLSDGEIDKAARQSFDEKTPR